MKIDVVLTTNSDSNKNKNDSYQTEPKMKSDVNSTRTGTRNVNNGSSLTVGDRRIYVLRVMFVVTIIMAAATCGAATFCIIRRLEHQYATSSIDNMSHWALARATKLASSKLQGAELLADLYASTFPNREQWPFVAVDDRFMSTASRIGLLRDDLYHDHIVDNDENDQAGNEHELLNTQSFALNVLVHKDQIEDFNEHAKVVFERNNYPEGTGYSRYIQGQEYNTETTGTFFGVFDMNGPNRQRQQILPQNRTNAATQQQQQQQPLPLPYSQRYPDIVTPLFQGNVKKLLNLMLFDLHSTVTVGPWIESLIDCSIDVQKQQQRQQLLHNDEDENSCSLWEKCKYNTVPCTYSTSKHHTIQSQEPVVNIGVPIFLPSNVSSGNYSDYTTMLPVALVTSLVHISEVVSGAFPSYIKGMMAVITSKNDDRDAHTYMVEDGQAIFVGEGDQHDDAQDEYGSSVVLNDIPNAAPMSVQYTLSLYPTTRTFEEYYTPIPIIVSMSLVGIILLSTLIFGGYDQLVREESRRRKAILELKRRFVRFISHEIRTPLNTSCMGLDLLTGDMNEFVDSVSGDGHCSNDELMKTKLDEWLNILNDVNDNCRNSVSVLNDILSYDKIEAGTFQIEREPVNMTEIVQKTVDEFQVQLKNIGKQLKLKIVEDFDTCGDSQIDQSGTKGSNNHVYCAHGDPIRLSQVVRNLISNALKFANGSIVVSLVYKIGKSDPTLNGSKRSCGKTITEVCQCVDSSSTITSSTNETSLPVVSGSIEVSVQDDGVGLDENQLSLLFGEGVQFDANRLQHGEGSGLGLFISRNIVLKHGGSIHAESDGPGLGSVFIVELPLYQFRSSSIQRDCSIYKQHHRLGPTRPDQNRLPNPSRILSGNVRKKDEKICLCTRESSESTKSPRRRRVLVVEDVQSNRKMLVRLLERAGHECSVASNGQEAIDIIKKDLEKQNNADSTAGPPSSMIDVLEDCGDSKTDTIFDDVDIERRPHDTILMDNEMRKFQ